MIIPQCRAGCPHVTHPSATKIRKIPAEALILNIFVRLACVKHAASVHPEPGSNSYIKVLFPASCLAFLRFFRNRQTLVFFRLPPVELTMGCVFLSIVQFSRIRSAFSAAKSILSDVISLVKHFFRFFQSFFACPPWHFLPQRQNLSYQIRFCLSSTFFDIFQSFSA